MNPIKCYRCGTKLKKGSYMCTSCKEWNMGPSAASGTDDGTILLSDVPEYEVMRYQTGMIDECLGGGMVKTSVILMGGPPGAGKTTISLQLAGRIAQTNEGREALYIAAEQPLKEIKATAKRLQSKWMQKIRMLSLMGETNADLESTIVKYKPCVVILDSLNGLVGDDYASGVEVCENLKVHAGLFETPVIVISQINKAEDFAGLMRLQHAVDVLMIIEIREDSKRVFKVPVKNRFGATPVEQVFAMTEMGLVLAPDPEEPEEDVPLLTEGEEEEEDDDDDEEDEEEEGEDVDDEEV